MVRNQENPQLSDSPNTPQNSPREYRDDLGSPRIQKNREAENADKMKEGLGFNLSNALGNELPSKPSEVGANSFTTETTGYWPAPSDQVTAQKGEAVAKMEGGSEDRMGNPIWPDHTLDAVESKMMSGGLGPDDYVAVAMDSSAFPYGTNLTSPAYPGIQFRVVDTGGAFQGKGTAKVDIATSNHDRMDKLSAKNVRFDRVGGGGGMAGGIQFG